jgi:hypothetical protein
MAHASRPEALTSGFQHAFVACAFFLLGASVRASRTVNTRGQKIAEAGPALEAG